MDAYRAGGKEYSSMLKLAGRQRDLLKDARWFTSCKELQGVAKSRKEAPELQKIGFG